jgi:small neutral amino acid transporter SnatA (MarC family)
VFALALIVVSAIVGGLLFFVLPIAILAVAISAGLDLRRRRQDVVRMNRHREQARPSQVEFTERDRETLTSD